MSPPNQKEATFTGLPPELRGVIYDFLVPEKVDIVVKKRIQTRKKPTRMVVIVTNRADFTDYTRLTQVCGTVYDELHERLTKRVKIVLDFGNPAYLKRTFQEPSYRILNGFTYSTAFDYENPRPRPTFLIYSGKTEEHEPSSKVLPGWLSQIRQLVIKEPYQTCLNTFPVDKSFEARIEVLKATCTRSGFDGMWDVRLDWETVEAQGDGEMPTALELFGTIRAKLARFKQIDISAALGVGCLGTEGLGRVYKIFTAHGTAEREAVEAMHTGDFIIGVRCGRRVGSIRVLEEESRQKWRNGTPRRDFQVLE